MGKQLTTNQKAKWYPLIIRRDYKDGEEPTCLYCEQRFIDSHKWWKRVYDHLNNDETDNRIENLAFAHWYCNNNKKDSPELQMIALQKLEENEKLGFEPLGEREGEKNAYMHAETNMEIDSNIEFSRITEEYLIERLLSNGGNPPAEGEISFKDSLNNITYRCRNVAGHASQNTIRRIIDMFCCTEGNYEKVKKNGIFVIQKRYR